MSESSETVLINELKAALLNTGTLFPNLSQMNMPIENKEAFEALLSKLEENFKGGMSLPEQGRKINIHMNNETGLTFKICKPFEGMKFDKLSSIFQLPIFVIEAGDINSSANEIRLKAQYHPQPNIPFAEEKTIFIWPKDSLHNFLLYTKEEIDKLYIPAGATTKYKKKTQKKEVGKVSAPVIKKHIVLGCNHFHIIDAIKEKVLNLKKANPNTDLVLKCPTNLCFYIAKDEEAKKILESDYDTFYKTDKVNYKN